MKIFFQSKGFYTVFLKIWLEQKHPKMLMTPGGEILGGLSISLFFLWSCPLLYKVYRLV